MKGKMFGTTIPGYHAYKIKNMHDIRLLGVFPVVTIIARYVLQGRNSNPV